MAIITKTKENMPGIIISLIIALAAMFLNGHYGAPTMLFALLLGLAVNFIYDTPKIRPGITFTSKTVLRIGVALLGLRIALSDVSALGWQPLALIIFAVFSTIMVGILISRLFGYRKRFGALTGGAVAICGASAAMAISCVLPKDKGSERDTIFAVVGVTTLSTIAMILYPILTDALGYTDTQAGLFIGATIHDVAQVVGAGYMISEPAGDLSSLIKMIRVAMLVPVVMIFAYMIKQNAQAGTEGHAAAFPLFLMAFIALMLINSFVMIPVMIKQPLIDLSKICLTTAIVAIGIKTRLQDIFELGIKPILLMVLETLWIALIFIIAIPFL